MCLQANTVATWVPTGLVNRPPLGGPGEKAKGEKVRGFRARLSQNCGKQTNTKSIYARKGSHIVLGGMLGTVLGTRMLVAVTWAPL